MLVTVFTPSYNRASYLHQLYQSLCNQACMDFEWIIVDDGSKDNTSEVMEQIISANTYAFDVRYYYKENGGKHTAINKGVKEAKGDLFLILDSDDSLPPNAIADVLEQYKDIEYNADVAGVSGLMAHHDGTQIGSGYPDGCDIVSSIEMRYKYGVTGDLMEVWRTSVLKEFPFPEIKGERFSPEALVWNRIARKYKLKCFNKVIYYRDYLDGGLTDNIVKIRMNSPMATVMCYAELMDANIPFIQKIKTAINYWRFRFCIKEGKAFPKIGMMWNITAPVGYLMHLRDKKTIKK